MNTDSEGGMESVCTYNGVSVLIGLNLEKTGWANFFSGTKQTVRNNELSILSSCS